MQVSAGNPKFLLKETTERKNNRTKKVLGEAVRGVKREMPSHKALRPIESLGQQFKTK